MNLKKPILALFVLMAIAAGTALLMRSVLQNWPGGMSPTDDPSRHDRKLTHVARTASPIILAAKTYFEKHGVYPATVAELQSESSVGFTANEEPMVIEEWFYHVTVDGKSFSLGRKLGWDPSLVYTWSGTTENWTFSPGDGSDEKPLTLKL